jgi:MYXO-CTERM domain-containing protein
VKRAGLAIVLAAIALALVASTVWAFVRSRTTGGVGVHWTSGCAFVTPDSAGTPDLPADQVFATVQKAVSNWQTALGSQAYLKLMYRQPMPLEAHLDGINTVKFRTDHWCHPNDAQQNNVCYSSAAAGITTVFYVQDGNDKAGAILDADIELNDINYTFAILPTTNQPRLGTTLADLENTLTHELGHLQGLDHTCTDAATPSQEYVGDTPGDKPPSCAMLNTLPLAEQMQIKTATMYNFAAPGETSKRTVHLDDVAGIVDAYPPANDPGTCGPINLDDFKTKGCSMGGASPSSPLPLTLVALALVALVARRRA